MTHVLCSDYDPFAAAVQADPYPYYAALRREAPVQYVESLDAYAVSRHADVRRVMHDHRTFSSQAMAALVSRPVQIGNEAGVFDEPTNQTISIVGLDGDDHNRLRTIVNRGFTPRRIARLEQEMRALAGGFVDALVSGERSDLMADFAVPFPTVVIASMLGIDPGRRDDFRRWSEHMVLAVFEPTTPEQQQAIARSGDQMGEYLDAVIATRNGEGGDDLISVLLRAELEGGALTHEELEVFVFTLLVAGSITTAYLIGNAVATLAEEQALLTQVRAEPSICPSLIEESLRCDPPVQMMFRTAMTDVEIAGVRLPKGVTVLPLLGAANRDETVFAEPDRFDLARNCTEQIAFGHGVHFCLGASLARLEARVAVEELLDEPAGSNQSTRSIA
jgi:cytochrome P450